MKNYTIPLRLIAVLADGQFHSGQVLGEQFGMSRVAINKHMQALRDWGLDIFTVTRKGYCLSAPLMLLNKERISEKLKIPRQIELFPIIDSTNEYLLKHIQVLQSGDVCLAEYQQSGRGRRGRKWFSPFGSNLYLSMFWRFEHGPAAVVGLSLVVGVIIAEILQLHGVNNIRLKWPNDIYIEQCKLAGILVELTGKSGDCANVIIGIGINVSMCHSDKEIIDQSWTSLAEMTGKSYDRNYLAAEIINALQDALMLFEKEGLVPFIERWNKLDNFIGQSVKLLVGDKEIYGTAQGINQQGALLLEKEGKLIPFVGGEISLRRS